MNESLQTETTTFAPAVRYLGVRAKDSSHLSLMLDSLSIAERSQMLEWHATLLQRCGNLDYLFGDLPRDSMSANLLQDEMDWL